jgi:hypothetical protein
LVQDATPRKKTKGAVIQTSTKNVKNSYEITRMTSEMFWKSEEPLVIADVDGQQYVKFNLKSAPVVRLFENLNQACDKIFGYHSKPKGNVWSLELVARNLDAIKDEFDEWDMDKTSLYPNRLFHTAELFAEEITKRLKESLTQGIIEFNDLPFLFQRGDKIYWGEGNEMCGGIYESTNITTDYFSGRCATMKINVLHNLNMFPAVDLRSAKINQYEGPRSINDLPIRKLTPEIEAKLVERGKKFRKIILDDKGTGYRSYTGNLVQRSWWGDSHTRADGRIIVDAKMAHRMANDKVSSNAQLAGFDNSSRRSNQEGASIQAISDDMLFMVFPTVLAFSFFNKKWGEVYLDNVEEINWREDSFEKLVLDDNIKGMIKTLVSNSENNFSDIIEGKGGGIIFLLHGEPGQGKTLTAESVAELLHRPLYSVSIGELGTDPTYLETKLRSILDVVTVWNAVLLLDEADIFLEARDGDNILRNAMVGVFLRLLEYHQGVLFLTTNRVKQIDEAFYSRISLAIRYGAAGSAKLDKIWHNLSQAAKIVLSNEEIHDLSIDYPKLNGRQIKNIIRIALMLSKSENKKVDIERIKEIVEITTKFEKDMSK